MDGSPRFLALNREASLALEVTTTGLDAIYNAHYGNPGLYFKAFFNLSTALERLGKLATVIDFLIENEGNFPTDAYLRKIGHDVEILLQKMLEIRSKHDRDDQQLSAYPNDNITNAMVSRLTDFAKGARYYNLDFLVGGTGLVGATGDPLATWYEQVSIPILSKHYPENRRKTDLQRAAYLGEAMKPFVFVKSWDEVGNEISDLALIASKSAETRYLQRWTAFYLCRIFRFSTILLGDLSKAAVEKRITFVPWMSDHYGRFYNDDAFLKRYRVWRYW